MQDNSITIPNDPLNNGSIVNEVYERFVTETNKTTYKRDGIPYEEGDVMSLYRTEAKRNGASKGQRKSAVKFTKTVDVPNADGSGDISLPLIAELSFSVPYGTPTATVVELLQRIHAFTDMDAAVSLVDELEI